MDRVGSAGHSPMSAGPTFTPPDIWNFPPFFTCAVPALRREAWRCADPDLCRIQPVEATREKQLHMWEQLILSYHRSERLFSMSLESFPFFQNEEIERERSRCPHPSPARDRRSAARRVPFHGRPEKSG